MPPTVIRASGVQITVALPDDMGTTRMTTRAAIANYLKLDNIS